MRFVCWIAVIACIGCVGFSQSADAQGQGALEFGVDAAISYAVVDDYNRNFTKILVPPTFRVGYFPSNVVGLESSFSAAYAKVESRDNATALSLGLDVVGHLGFGSESVIPFIQAGVRISYDNYGSRDDTMQLGLGGGAGVKILVANRLAVRVQLGLDTFFEDESSLGGPAHKDLIGAIGVSFFTK